MAMAHDHQARQGALSLPAISLASSEMVTRPRRQCNTATLQQCHCAPRRFPKTNGQPRVIIYHWPAAGHEHELLCALQRSTARTETVLPARQCRQFPAAVAVARAFCTQSASGRTANAAQSNWYLLLYLVYDNAADLLHSASNAPLPATVPPRSLLQSFYLLCLEQYLSQSATWESVLLLLVCYTRLFYGAKLN